MADAGLALLALWRSARHWSARGSGPAAGWGSLFAAAGAVDGGQRPCRDTGARRCAGGSLAWTWDPLARRPVAIVARINTAGNGGDGSAQAAVGVRWQVAPWLNLSAERLIAIGQGGRDDWTVRIAGGKAGSWRRVTWSGYGEPAPSATATCSPVARRAPR